MEKLIDRRKIRKEILKKQEKEESSSPSSTQNRKLNLEKKFKIFLDLLVKKFQKLRGIFKKKFKLFFSKEKKDKVFKKIEKGANKLNTKIDNFGIKLNEFNKRSLKKIGRFFLKIRYEFLIILLLGILLSNLWGLDMRFRGSNFITRGINFYPMSIFNQLEFARLTFDTGNEGISNYFWNKSVESLNFLRKIGLASFIEPKISETKNYIETPKRKNDYLGKINEKLKDFPFCWQILAKKAEIEAELYQKEELEKTLALIVWINPKFDRIGFLKALEK